MHIGFDAKRYFHNNTGLGNYSRTLVNGLARLYPQHQYSLFNPKPAVRFAAPAGSTLQEVLPQTWWHRKLPAVWRSRGMVSTFKEKGISLYHGLSHELPNGIRQSGTRSVVTVHDLIFERYPHQYGWYEVRMHRHKIQHACIVADRVIAISRQTAADLHQFYGIPEKKIEVCYQSCDPLFAVQQSETRRELVREAYGLPGAFLLYVGSVIERKNLLGLAQAMHAAGTQLHLPLVVVGTGKQYRQQVNAYLQRQNLATRVYFLSDAQGVPDAFHINKTENLAALYQMATALIYPSYFEGFGIPVLEALWSRVPVITSNTSCMPETAGNGALLVDPASIDQMSAALLRIQDDADLRQNLVDKGWRHAQHFTLEKCCASVMAVYENLL